MLKSLMANMSLLRNDKQKVKIPLNRDEYSDESKRSLGHEYLGDEYKDIKYKCAKCEKKALFTASEQKQAFEVRKEYMWIKRTLCTPCWREMRKIKSKLQAMELHYCENKEQSLNSKDFLTSWLTLLVLHPQYGKTANPARIVFVKKYLAMLKVR